jgi:3-phosphoglycerate kinase
MKIASLDKARDLSGRRVFLRVDFNVPLSDGRIIDDYKIKSGLETIEYLVAKGAKVIIATHLGEPQGYQGEFSCAPIARALKKLLKKEVLFAGRADWEKVFQAVNKLPDGSLLFLENLRFNSGEYDNDKKFAKTLASLADIYVNDALAVSHRRQASIAALSELLPSYAGFLLEKELKAFDKVMSPEKPLLVIMGGAKISTKAPLISKMKSGADNILIGGALANNFWKYQGFEIGLSKYDKDSEQYIARFFRKSGALDKKIILPLDVVVKGGNGEARVTIPSEVKKNDCILDIGPKSIEYYCQLIKGAKTMVWNGPLGKFEESSYRHGTMTVARALASRSSGRAFGLVGGGETVAAIKASGMAEYVDWISTAGGAMLTFLGGGQMPGLKQLIKKI